MLANAISDLQLFIKMELFLVQPEDVANYHTPSSLERGPFYNSYGSVSKSFGNPMYDLVTYASKGEYPALKATMESSFPDFDFTNLVPWNFKIIKSFDQAKQQISWNFSSAFQNADKVVMDIIKAIEDTLNIQDCQIYKYEPDGSDAFSDMGYPTTFSYFFVDETKNKVLFLHMREGDGDCDMSDDDNVSDARYGYGLF
ncbi:hypothetical protein TVAG_384920 [Trichomonas vaginalis G3]|uniref:Repressor of RNA polymerase III transcription n=1 Tax=Trichomonas vaginalis (strain ATCC PRA-98 / G3) TaxID=412133 RepID=A2GV89_TRIV3|nr:RNA polymerase III core binding [Trichomonas vaginalis G3]EAX78928.1 hypothetical protein TVAG_384920 [Trichomonas vaginalis G3]KAI5494774.1 RNA polymerase III core binding [Trichomonas vaginalis G3]|eukprot:XP_001291858.1 hypothetical protein [Trichomonas vaginalis G3]